LVSSKSSASSRASIILVKSAILLEALLCPEQGELRPEAAFIQKNQEKQKGRQGQVKPVLQRSRKPLKECLKRIGWKRHTRVVSFETKRRAKSRMFQIKTPIPTQTFRKN
jgi:hypothetical protein